MTVSLVVKCGHNGPYGPDGWFRVGTVNGTFYMRYFIICIVTLA